MATVSQKTDSAVLERLEALHHDIEQLSYQLHALMAATSSRAVLRAVPATAKPTELTQRQQLILKLIAEGRTNNDIADLLTYSESLIRQETIKIYDFLGCNGRAEAAAIYLRNTTHPKSAS